jgi:hypothetical protein
LAEPRRSSLIRRATAWVVGMALVLAPAVAVACPACAGREKEGNLSWLYVVWAMILVPYGISVAVIRAIRNVESDSLDEKATDGETK